MGDLDLDKLSMIADKHAQLHRQIYEGAIALRELRHRVERSEENRSMLLPSMGGHCVSGFDCNE